MIKKIQKETYHSLLDEITSIYSKAQVELVSVYWEIGKRIVEVEQAGDLRAEYGASLLEKLSADLTERFGRGFSYRNLLNMRHFYLQNKKMQTSARLKWSQQVELLSLPDHRKRKQLERRAYKKGLTARDLRKLIKQERYQDKDVKKQKAVSKKKRPSVLRRPSNLQFDTYRKIKTGLISPKVPATHRLVDCGFHIYCTIPKTQKITEMVRPAYAYRAVLDHVVDGDTLVAMLDLGFEVTSRQNLRLRGVNAPERDTTKGQEVSHYLKEFLHPGMPIVVKTYSRDSYGRYIADVFFEVEETSFDLILEKGIFLNQLLLKEGLVERM